MGGVPARLLLLAQTLLPNWTAEVLRFGNTLLPKAGTGHSAQTGRDLDDQRGSLYRLLSTLGKRAGQHLNQPRLKRCVSWLTSPGGDRALVDQPHF